MTQEQSLQEKFDSGIDCQLYLLKMKKQDKKNHGNWNKAIFNIANVNKKIDKRLTELRNDPAIEIRP